jgi:two-component system chemotaxis response regulator CheB
VLLAASTGGPQTLMNFIPSFPATFPGAVLLVQHMPGAFTSQFAAQLGQTAKLKVKEAEQGELIRPSMIYVCPGSHHMRVSPTGRITLDDGPRVEGYKPCANLAMETMATYAGPMGIGVVMTGMGTDGSKGATAIKAAGGHVIAQDEATSVIFGMPAEAIKTGAVDQVLPIDQIYSAIEKRVLYIFGASKVGAL